jgi:hypothetical protein
MTLAGILIALLIAVAVYNDAKPRGMEALPWAAGVFLLMIIFLPLYFILRKPKMAEDEIDNRNSQIKETVEKLRKWGHSTTTPKRTYRILWGIIILVVVSFVGFLVYLLITQW